MEESLETLDTAAAIDGLFAETHYERGQTLLGLGRTEEAKAAFQRALEEDVCPLRSLPEMNDIVRDVAAATGVGAYAAYTAAVVGAAGIDPGPQRDSRGVSCPTEPMRTRFDYCGFTMLAGTTQRSKSASLR